MPQLNFDSVVGAAFKYEPQWQGPLSGRSFEKQTEEAINALLRHCDTIVAKLSLPATPTSNGLMTSRDKAKLDALVPIVNSYIDSLFV